MKARQLSLFPEKKYKQRKAARAISLSSPNHIVLKANIPVLRASHVLVRQVMTEMQKR